MVISAGLEQYETIVILAMFITMDAVTSLNFELVK